MSKKMLQAAAGNAGDDNLYVEDVFSTYLYTGNNSTQTIDNGIDLDGEGGLVWFKRRSTSRTHVLIDTERGKTSYLQSNENFPAETGITNTITSFNSDGFSISDQQDINGNAETVASWTFRKAEKFFDIVTYTGTGSVQNISHNLGVAPAFIITKKTSSTSNWATNDPSQANPWSGALLLNSSNAFATASTVWNDTAPTDSVFTVGTADATNLSGQTYVAYLFASDAGGFGDDGDENIIKCGSYVGSADTAPYVVSVDLGFEPQWLLVKNVTTGGAGKNWLLVDTMRGFHATGADKELRPNTSDAENDSSAFNVTSTGFSSGSGGEPNIQGNTYIYIAIRRPMKTPESGTEVFDFISRTGTGSAVSVSSPILTDALLTVRPSGNDAKYFFDRPRGGPNYLNTTSNAVEGSSSNAITEFGNDYIKLGGGLGATNGNGSNYLYYLFQRATGFMDLVAYIGTNSNGNQSQAVNHNLAVVPEFIICKNRGRASGGWISYHKDLNGGVSPQDYYIYLERTTAAGGPDGIAWGTSGGGGVAPTSTNFTVGGYYDNGYAVDTYIAYLFATLDGVSKVGSYTGTGSNVDVDCGFSAGARFILIKRTSGAGDWYVYDSERGIVAGNDPYILANSTAAQVTNTDYIDPLASGFTVTSSGGNELNDNGSTYIFLAIA